MFDVLGFDEIAFSGEYSPSMYYFIAHDDKYDVFRLNEDSHVALDTGYSDFCKPVEDWMLD